MIVGWYNVINMYGGSMKNVLKVIIIVIGVLVGIIIIDTFQAKIFNNSPLLKIRDYLGEDICESLSL